MQQLEVLEKTHFLEAKFGERSTFHPACQGGSLRAAARAANGAGGERKVAEAAVAGSAHPASAMGSPWDVPLPGSVLDGAANRVDRLAKYIYKHGDARAKMRAMLCHIFHFALHDQFHEARDMLLMSHIMDNITTTDISTQVLFNRVMAQLGICAFRAGMIEEAHECLVELCRTGGAKELLAQGVSYRRHGDSADEQKEEKRRMLPYHMHINLDLIEVVHLTSAMLMEVPYMAAMGGGTDPKQAKYSKTFRIKYDTFEHTLYVGPPEHFRDHIMHAAKHLFQGDWAQCCEMLLPLEAWKLMPNKVDEVKAMLRNTIKEETLRTYILAYGNHYDSISWDTLMSMFDLEENRVHAIISKMMFSKRLLGSWDQTTRSIVLLKVRGEETEEVCGVRCAVCDVLCCAVLCCAVTASYSMN